MIAKSSDISALHGFSLVSLMHMGYYPRRGKPKSVSWDQQIQSLVKDRRFLFQNYGNPASRFLLLRYALSADTSCT